MSLFNIRSPHIYKPGRPILRLMLSLMTRQISGTFMHIYSAIYIFQAVQGLGYNIHFSVVFVLFFYFLSFFVKWIFLFVGQYISARFGFKNTIRFSVIPYFFYILTLFTSKNNLAMFLLASVFAGINAGLYWWGYHGYFVKKGQKKHFGSSLGEANILETLAAILTPLTGAFIIYFFGFNSLFALSFIFVLISAVLLGKGSKTRQKHTIKVGEVVSLLETHKATSLAYFGIGAEAVVASITWPLFLFLFFGQVVSLGLAVTLSALLASLFSMLIATRVDNGEGDNYVRTGSVLLLVTWILKIFTRSLGVFILSDSLSNFGRNMVTLPLNTLSYKKAIESQTSMGILFYESAQIFGTLVMLLAVASYVFFGFNIEVSFIGASLASILPLVWVFKKKNK